MKRPVKGAAEEDTFTPWRRLYCYLQRPGVAAKIKRHYRRGERRQARREIRKEDA